MKAFIVAVCLLTIAGFCDAQNVIKPGDKAIRYDWIGPSHTFYKNIITDTAGKIKYEFMMDDVTTIDSINKRIIFARVRQLPVGSFSADTSITDFTFKPISMHETHAQYRVNFDMNFADKMATVKTIRKGVISVKTYPMQSGYFEDNMIEYIFGYLELKKNITYTMDNFNKDTPAPSDPYTIAYAFDDVWNLGAGYKVNCTVLHFTHGGTTGYIWIDKNTHDVLKEEGSFKTGSYVVTKQ